jgi:hypothetical protein
MLDNLLDKKSSIDKYTTNKNEPKYKVIEKWKDEE